MEGRFGASGEARLGGRPRLAPTLRRLSALGDVDETLQSAVDLAVELVDGCSHAGVMIWRAGTATTPVSSSEVAFALGALQAACWEGPFVAAPVEPAIMVANGLADDERFGRFGPRAWGMGIGAAVSYQLLSDRRGGEGGAAFNLYGATRDVFDATSVDLGAVLAAHAAAALDVAIAREGLEASLASREVIGRAKRVLVVRDELSGSEAFEQIRESSYRRGSTVGALATAIVDADGMP